MNKKFSIITINIEKIFKELDNYINQYGYYYSPYLFMSDATAKAIENEYINYDYLKYDARLSSNKNKESGAYAEFAGHKVYINNDLSYGVVEIR